METIKLRENNVMLCFSRQVCYMHELGTCLSFKVVTGVTLPLLCARLKTGTPADITVPLPDLLNNILL